MNLPRLTVRHFGMFLLTLALAHAGLAPVDAADPQQAAQRAAALLKQVGVNRGLCVAVGQEAEVVLELVQSSDLLVLVREPDAKARARLQQAADEAGLGIDRLVIQAGDSKRLPYADRLVDAVITATAKLGDKEAMRALRPEGVLIRTDGKQLVTRRRPPQKGAGDWSHWEHGPDNNPVSTDNVIKAPYMTQFMARPFYIGMPSVTTAAAGRTFLAIGHIAQPVDAVWIGRIDDKRRVAHLRRQQMTAQHPLSIVVIFAKTPAPQNQRRLQHIAGVIGLAVVAFFLLRRLA